MSRLIVVFTFLTLFFSSQTAGQIYPFKHYTSKDGLLSNDVLTFSQDHLGRLWIGTDEGVSIFDGLNFTNLTIADSLSNSRINVILPGKFDSTIVWLGTNGGGLCKYTPRGMSNILFSPQAISNIVTALYEDDNGMLYCGTINELFALDISSNTFHLVPSLSGRSIDWIFSDAYQNIFVVSGNDLYSVHNRLAKLNFHFPRERYGSLSGFSRTSDDRIVFGTDKGWLLLFNGKAIEKSYRLIHTQITGIAATADHCYVSSGEGLFEVTLSPFTSKHFIPKNGLLSHSIDGCFVDRDGSVWTASYTLGISVIRSFDVQKILLPHSFNGTNGSLGASDSAGHIWMCVDDGLTECWKNEQQQWILMHHTAIGPYSLLPRSIFIDSENQCIIGDASGNVMKVSIHTRKNQKSILSVEKFFPAGNFLPHANPLFVFEDSKQRVWCSYAENKGLFIIPSEGIRKTMHLRVEDGLPDNSIRAIAEDQSGAIWLGSYDHGLFEVKFVNGKPAVKNYNSKLRAGESAVRSLVPIEKGSLLVGTRYKGLLHFNGNDFRQLVISESGIWCAKQSPGNIIMLGTQSGIQFLHDDSLASPPLLREFIDEPVFSVGTLPDTTRWMMTPSTLITYKEKSKTFTPPIVWIGSCEIEGKSIPDSQLANLSYDQNTISVQLNASSLRSGKNLFFQWRFAGKTDWSKPTPQRSLTFASLNSGNYTLEIRGIDFDGNISVHPAQLSFTIHPPFWKTWWFILLAALAIALSAGGIVWLKASQLIHIERLRSRIAADLHDEIGSGLTRIALLSDVVKRQIHKKSRMQKHDHDWPQMLDTVHATAQELVESLGDVVWSLDKDKLSLTQLVQRFSSFAGELFEAKGIRLTLRIDDNIHSIILAQEQLSSLLLFLKEATNNIVRHSDARHVSIEIKKIERQLSILIEDDGKGFVIGANDGNGLRTMQRRIERLGGSFDLTSIVHSGTTITATIPLKTKTA